MKSTTVAGAFTLLNITFQWVPSASLLLAMGLAITLDFITGVIKAIVQKQNRTSEGYRKTIVKFVQYGGAVGVAMLLNYVSSTKPSMANVSLYMGYLNDGLLSFIIFIETTSVLENMYAIDSSTPFSRWVIKPLLRLFTFQIKNNPLTKIKTGDEQPS